MEYGCSYDDSFSKKNNLMDNKKEYKCNCGWKGVPKVNHIYTSDHTNRAGILEDRILYTKTFHCKDCDHLLHSDATLTFGAALKDKNGNISFDAKSVPLPYIFEGKKYKLEILKDKFHIHPLDIALKSSIFDAECKVECFAEVFYEAVLKYEAPDMPANVAMEFRVPESEIDSFCEYFLKQFFEESQPRRRKFPQPQGNPPPFDPNSLPWKITDPNKIPTPYYPPKPYKRTDPYGETEEKSWIKDFKDMMDKMKEEKYDAGDEFG